MGVVNDGTTVLLSDMSVISNILIPLTLLDGTLVNPDILNKDKFFQDELGNVWVDEFGEGLEDAI